MNPENEDILVQLATDVHRYYPRLLSMYIDPLYAYVARRITNEEDAKDIMQNISMCVYLALQRYPAERIRQLQLRPWLYKITENACLNYCMRDSTVRLLPLDTSEGSVHLDIPDTGNESPDVIAQRHEDRCELLAEMSKLPKKDQEILFLRFFNDLSNGEIATKLQLGAGAVRVRIHRAISDLRQMLTKQEAGNGKEKNNAATRKSSQQESPAEYNHFQESHYQKKRNKHVVSDNK